MARAIDEHVINQKPNVEDKLQQTIHVVQEHNASTPISLRLPSASPGSELEDFNSTTRSTSPVPQTANRKIGNKYAKLSQPEHNELELLKSIMQTMEDEFEEILKAEQRKRQDEITVLETKHQRELNQLRDKYETRVDSLISIIKSLG
ncbi:hypothetical protein F4821DRAFT_279269 [Hypoxylon rubiginosum]|uniref:Uncharacterized protein n=1 Tax=Hypoxylon rubiginosum TaxID=110542 RepID=A0ACC0CYF6_9PEZI|nr:hypothetical protein F4821DRAFT_279269 [Hypoxylon rubiginosum]